MTSDGPQRPIDQRTALRLIAEAQGVDPEDIESLIQRENESRPSYDRLKEFRRILLSTFDSAQLVNVEGQEGVLVIASAWAAFTFRCAHATFVLWELGLKDAAHSTSRVALEHSVYLSMLAASPQPQTVIDSLEDRYLGLLERILESADEQSAVLLAALSAQLPNRDELDTERWAGVFEQVCNRFETGERIYLHYRMLCSEMHPGFGTAAHYILQNALARGSQAHILSPNFLGTDVALLLAVDSCVWAGWSIDSLFKVDIFDPVVAPIAREMDIHRLRLKQRQTAL